jgi:hypothetical protein
MQHFALTQQQNWGMGSTNGMGMRGMVTGMQNMQNIMATQVPRGEGEGEGEGEGPNSGERGVRGPGGDICEYLRDNHGQKVQGPSKRNVDQQADNSLWGPQPEKEQIKDIIITYAS